MGLNLLSLLSQNRLADFHTVRIELLNQSIVDFSLQELELLPPKDIQTNLYIKHPVSLEQYLMEGSYNKVNLFSPYDHIAQLLLKVFLAKENVPSPLFTFFMDILLNTIRYDIGDILSFRTLS